jgi:hypothetical protein
MASALAAEWPKGPVPKVVLRLLAAAAGASGTGWPEVAAVSQARRSAVLAVSAGQAAALPPGEPEARDAAEAGVAAPHGEAVAAVGAPREEAAVGAAAPHGEAVAAVGAPREAGAAEAEAPHVEAVGARAGEAPPRAVPASAAVPPSAVAWAFRRGRVLPWLAP